MLFWCCCLDEVLGVIEWLGKLGTRASRPILRAATDACQKGAFVPETYPTNNIIMSQLLCQVTASIVSFPMIKVAKYNGTS